VSAIHGPAEHVLKAAIADDRARHGPAVDFLIAVVDRGGVCRAAREDTLLPEVIDRRAGRCTTGIDRLEAAVERRRSGESARIDRLYVPAVEREAGARRAKEGLMRTRCRAYIRLDPPNDKTIARPIGAV